MIEGRIAARTVGLAVSVMLALAVSLLLPVIAARSREGREARLRELKKYGVRPLNLR